MAEEGRSENHWRVEEYTQRMSTKSWRKILLEGDDTIIYRGRLRKLQAKSLGYGVVEVSKVPLEGE